MKHLILALLLSFTLISTASQAGDVYDRVLEKRTLKCGYNYYQPVLWKDAKTNELKGIYVDYMQALGEVTGLKVEWTAEVPWADAPIALKSKKVDAFCAGTWADAKRGLQIAFTTPVFFNAIEAYARADDDRFDKQLNAINNADITIVTLDGAQVDDIAKQDFPKAQRFALTAMSSDAEQLLALAAGKGDITFTNHGPAHAYMIANPGKIKRVAPDKPLRVFSVTTAVDIQEQALLSVLNNATQQLHQAGIIDKILDKYEKDFPGAIMRVAKPYEISK